MTHFRETGHIQETKGVGMGSQRVWHDSQLVMQGRFIDEISIEEVLTYGHLPSKLAAEQLGIGS